MVMVRVRPVNERERNEGARACINLDPNFPEFIEIQDKSMPKSFNFDFVVGEECNQEDIFNIVGKELTSLCLDGYNVCIFAYGQTGSGTNLFI